MLPRHLLDELRYVEVYTARRFPNLRAGAYTSPRRGPGLDFDRHRAYRPGDDVRRIDWNVTARLGTPFVRETHAERELDLVIAVDVSRSMELGTAARSKKEVQLLVAGCLVFSAIADRINTGFLSFSDRVLAFHPPGRARARAWRFLEEVWSGDAREGKTAILPALRHLASHLKREGVVFLVSDFLTDEDVFASPELRVLAVRHDVVAVVVEDAAEERLPPGSGMVALRDLESGTVRSVGLGRGVRERYAAAARQRRAGLSRGFYRVPIDHVFVRSGESAKALLEVFAARKRA
jgi:uncharacterized protein (DUF58 family)